MPRLSIWFIRAALIYLALGFTFGALLLANKGFPISPTLWRLLPAHIELLLIGWTLQLTMGVAFWILPRIRATRGEVRPAWAAFALLNAGLLLVSLGAALSAPAWVPLTGRVAELAAVAAFAVHAWPRVKAAGG